MASTGGDDSVTDSLDGESVDLSTSTESEADENEASLGNAQSVPNASLERENSIVDKDDDDDFDSDYDRENRFVDSSSTWRYFTENERALAASLDQQRANDLSIHLYNAHALKARVRDPEAVSNAKPHQSKTQWIKRNEDGSLPWHPDSLWTAWPLKHEDVPRPGEQLGVPVTGPEEDDHTYRKKEAWKPSDDLEEEIQAIMLRKAVAQFRQRDWVRLDPGENGSSNAPGRADKDAVMKDHGSKTEGAEDDEPSNLRNDDLRELAFLADDEEATAVLQPPVRHLLSSLDDLLIGLHKSRSSHVRNSSQNRSQSRRSRSRTMPKGHASQPRSKRAVRAPSSDQADRQTDESISDAVAGQDLQHGTEEGETPQPKRRRKVNPRDWRDILGIASLGRWDPAVIDRTARRCATLFGENITISGSEGIARTYGPNNVFIPVTETIDDDFIVQDDAEDNRHYCPVSICPRHQEPFRQAWRWREHLKRSHKYSSKEVERLEESMKSTDEKYQDNSISDGDDPEPDKVSVDAIPQVGDTTVNGGVRDEALLQPVAVKMGRGKDARPRKRKAS